MLCSCRLVFIHLSDVSDRNEVSPGIILSTNQKYRFCKVEVLPG